MAVYVRRTEKTYNTEHVRPVRHYGRNRFAWLAKNVGGKLATYLYRYRLLCFLGMRYPSELSPSLRSSRPMRQLPPIPAAFRTAG